MAPEQLAPEIEAAVAACAATGCRDAGLGIIPGLPTPAPTALPAQAVASVAATAPAVAAQAATAEKTDQLTRLPTSRSPASTAACAACWRPAIRPQG